MESKSFLKRDKGVAGLNILLAVVVLLFIIGFIVMIFAILGGELQDSAYDPSTGTTVNETLSSAITETGVNLNSQQFNSPVCSVIEVTNATDGTAYNTANYSTTECVVSFIGTANDDALGINNTQNLNFSYTFSVELNTTASDTIADSTGELAEVTDWYGIIIVMTAMVILILLTIIIISAIKGSGMIAMGGGAGLSETA